MDKVRDEIKPMSAVEASREKEDDVKKLLRAASKSLEAVYNDRNGINKPNSFNMVKEGVKAVTWGCYSGTAAGILNIDYRKNWDEIGNDFSKGFLIGFPMGVTASAGLAYVRHKANGKESTQEPTLKTNSETAKNK